MISEGDARELLARAAATIDVADTAPMTLAGMPEPARRRWPAVLAVAAAVAVVAGLGYGAAQLAGDGAPDAAPAVTGDPTEGELVAEDDEMPSLLGYTEEEARQLLEGRGLEVGVRPVGDGCDVPGTVVGASPAVGSALAPGDVVTLRVVHLRQVIDCVGEPDWQDLWGLVRLSRDLGDGVPDLAEQVGLSVVQGERVLEEGDRTAAELADPSAWTLCGETGCHSPLGGLAQMLTDPATWSSTGTPSLEVTQGHRCMPGGRRAWVAGSWRYHLWVDVAVDSISCPSMSLLLGADEQGAIDAVRLRLPAEADDITEPELAAGLERVAAAKAFVAWARGDDAAPDFADRVRLFDGGFTSAWNDDPEVREGWSGCSGLGFPDCGLDPVGTIARHEGPVVPTPGRSTCPAGDEVPREYADADVVRVGEAEPGTCRDAWAVELWVTELGRIYAVRQLGVAP